MGSNPAQHAVHTAHIPASAQPVKTAANSMVFHNHNPKVSKEHGATERPVYPVPKTFDTL